MRIFYVTPIHAKHILKHWLDTNVQLSIPSTSLDPWIELDSAITREVTPDTSSTEIDLPAAHNSVADDDGSPPLDSHDYLTLEYSWYLTT